MRFGKTIGSMIAVACLATINSNAANAAFFTNGSFEVGSPLPIGGFTMLPDGSTAITGWVVSGSVDWKATYWIASDGNYSVDLDGSWVGAVSQTFDTDIDTEYIVTFDFAGHPLGSDIKKATVSATGNAASEYSFDSSNSSNSSMGWVSKTYTFTATATSTTLTFASASTNPNSMFGPALDNVVVTAKAPVGPPNPVPVPAGMLLALTGLPMFGVMGWARRRKNIAA